MFPRLIHFVWAGGDKLMPLANILNVCLWARSNPTFEIYLWVDRRSYRASTRGIEAEYRDLFKKSSRQYFIKFNDQQLHIKDIEQEGLSNLWIRYEIDRLRPNYGASSDLIRYNALYKFGGCYFDSDIRPGEISVGSFYNRQQSLDSTFLFVDHNSQDAEGMGNDVFIATKFNPCMKAIADIANENYTISQPAQRSHPCIPSRIIHLDYHHYNIREYLAYQYDTQPFIQDMTPKKTGGGPVRAVVLPIVPSRYVGLVPSDLRVHRREEGNTWFSKRIIEGDLSELIAKVIECIKIEAHEMGVIRLDDHIENLQAGTGEQIDDIIAALRAGLLAAQIDVGMVQIAQSCRRFDATEQIYQEMGLDVKVYKPYIPTVELLKAGRAFYIIYSGISGATYLREHLSSGNAAIPEQHLDMMARCVNGFFVVLDEIAESGILGNIDPEIVQPLCKACESIEYILSLYEDSGLISGFLAHSDKYSVVLAAYAEKKAAMKEVVANLVAVRQKVISSTYRQDWQENRNALTRAASTSTTSYTIGKK